MAREETAPDGAGGDLSQDAVEQLRRTHAGWRLLNASNAAFIISFLHRTFIAPNARALSASAASRLLNDHLLEARARAGEDSFPRTALQYLEEWADDDHAYLRRTYPRGSDEAHFDLTPAASRALEWITNLRRRHFIGTESRLQVVLELLREVVHNTGTNDARRIEVLERKKAEIDAEIEAIRGGRSQPLDDTAVRDRFQQIDETSRRILNDFRDIEQNFRDLDREVRQKIAQWDGGRGRLLTEVFGEHDAIANSHQGKSFRAFWDFLMSPQHQDEFSALLQAAFKLPVIQELNPAPRLRRIHFDWLEAGEEAQKTVARLSHQLRRFVDDATYLENQRIGRIIRSVEQRALALKEHDVADLGITIDDLAPTVALPMERALYQPPRPVKLSERIVVVGDESSVPPDALFAVMAVDRRALEENVRNALRHADHVSLADVVKKHPLQHGIAELLCYLNIAVDSERGRIDDRAEQELTFIDSAGNSKRARIPLVTFTRTSTGGAGQPEGAHQ